MKSQVLFYKKNEKNLGLCKMSIEKVNAQQEKEVEPSVLQRGE